MERGRCGWAGDSPIYQQYHDGVWGEPQHDDQELFAMLCLEGAQAGLSWITILQREHNYRAAFDQFQPEVIAQYTETKLAELLQNEGIIRNKAKINSVVSNAQAFLNVQKEFGSFDAYIWQFVGGKPKINCFASLAEVPALTPESEAMSKDLKKRGFKFVGPTICYAYMQACGMVNDHVAGCFKYPCQS
ncbi:MAG: DNA-3-methyladenine glycosylase I [Anaerolineae bacterium]|nr:DNA-3-methyladenine glycosylase I [Anaerolineae bacterium]